MLLGSERFLFDRKRHFDAAVAARGESNGIDSDSPAINFSALVTT
jgi:hypothetical protein